MTRKEVEKISSGEGRSAKATVLVVSCDDYEDMLEPFAKAWQHYWPDCPFEVVMVTETRPETTPSVFGRAVRTRAGTSWSERVLAALATIDTPYVLLLCNDYFLSGKIDTQRVLRRVRQAEKYGAANVRLHEIPQAQKPFVTDAGEDALKEYVKRTPYCIAAYPGIWDRAFLKALVEKTRSAWDFERRGSFLVSDEEGPILTVPGCEFPFLDGVHKGAWEPSAVELFGRIGVSVDFERRGFVAASTRVREWVRAQALRFLPRGLLIRIRNMVQGDRT